MSGSVMRALTLAIAVSCAACGGPPTDSTQPVAPGLSGVSPKLLLFNQRAQPVEAKSLTGKPVVIAFIDTACTGMCQLTTNKLRRVADDLGAVQAQKVQFVLVTYNPVFDGPKRLTRYAADMHLDPSRWTLLTGSPDNIDWILGRFGLPAVGRAEEPAKLMDELDYVFLVAPDGRIVKKYKGADFITTNVSQDTKALMADSSSQRRS